MERLGTDHSFDWDPSWFPHPSPQAAGVTNLGGAERYGHPGSALWLLIFLSFTCRGAAWEAGGALTDLHQGHSQCNTSWCCYARDREPAEVTSVPGHSLVLGCLSSITRCARSCRLEAGDGHGQWVHREGWQLFYLGSVEGTRLASLACAADRPASPYSLRHTVRDDHIQHHVLGASSFSSCCPTSARQDGACGSPVDGTRTQPLQEDLHRDCRTQEWYWLPPQGTTLCLTVNTENCVPVLWWELQNLNSNGNTRMEVDFVKICNVAGYTLGTLKLFIPWVAQEHPSWSLHWWDNGLTVDNGPIGDWTPGWTSWHNQAFH